MPCAPEADVDVRLSALRRLSELIRRINAERGLLPTLQSVVDGVVDGLGFGVAAVNLVHVDGSFETVAVAGSDDARAQLLGERLPADAFDDELAAAEHWGRLRFVPHDRLPTGVDPGWVPPLSALHPDGGADAWHPMDALYAPLTSPSGELVGMLAVDLPADGRRPSRAARELLEMYAAQAGIAVDNARLTESLRTSEEAFRLAFDGAPAGMTLIALNGPSAGRFMRVNDAMCSLLGYSREELLQRRFSDITHLEDLGPDLDALAAAKRGEAVSVYRAEKRYVRADGTPVWVSIVTSMLRLSTGEALYAFTQVEDITDRKTCEQELLRRATQDPLTGLPNRVALGEAISAALERIRAGSSPDGAVLFCDLDGFKTLNDTCGHATGDAVLRIVAARMAEQVRAVDTVARLGGDEFVVLAEAMTIADAAALAARIEQSVAIAIAAAGITVHVTLSIGIAPLGAACPSVDAVLARADTAMYEAKAAGRKRRVTYSGKVA